MSRTRINLHHWCVLLIGTLLLGGCGMNLIPSHDQWYMQHYIIMQDFERDAYKQLSPEEKPEFQSLFWEARSPEAKAEFAKRLEFVMKAFKRENSANPWNTDRARIYLLNGSPASIEYKQTDDWGVSMTRDPNQTGSVDDRSKENIQARTAEDWTYQYPKAIIHYIFRFSAPKRWELATASFSGNRYLGEFEIRSRTTTFAINDIETYKGKLGKLITIK